MSSPTGSGSRTRWKVVLAVVAPICGALAGIIGVAANWLTVSDHLMTDPPPSQSPSASRAPVEEPTQPRSSAVSAAPADPTYRSTAESTCRDDSGPVDCDSPHRFETFRGFCTPEGLLLWLGGRSGRDVTIATVRSGEAGACLADLRIPLTGSAAGALGGDSADALRKCFSDRRGVVVPCNEAHSMEFISAEVKGRASDAECETAAGTYMGIDISQRAAELRSRAIAADPPAGDGSRCVIQLVGSQQLASSVRDLQNGQLHWVS